MKATFDLPDDLYRSAKARAALEGRPLRSVVVELFQRWLRSGSPGTEPEEEPTEEEVARYPWLAVSRRHLRPGMSHDLGEIREAAARAWGEAADTNERDP
ncbi:MAG: hypothetical protein WD342_15525 [Verrucomicrobiales bacterium]